MKMAMLAIHGMFAFGHGTIYFSHLPMFMAPHDEQAIFEVKLDARGLAAYNSLDGMVTVVPEPFDLQEMIAHPHAFRATIYRGHFERRGVAVATGVAVTPVAVVHAHELPAAPGADIEFGTSERFRAHFISAPPDFDEIDNVTTGERLYREDGDLQE